MKPLLGRLAGIALGLVCMPPAMCSEPTAGSAPTRVVEFRSYNLKPATREEFHRLVTDEGLPLLRRFQIEIVAHGPSTHDDTYPAPRWTAASWPPSIRSSRRR